MSFLRLCGAGLGLALTLGLGATTARAMDKIPDEYKINGFAVGCQAWSFNHFTVKEAIELTHKAGGKIIEFIPGQALSPDERNVKFDHHASDELIQQVKQWCKENDVLGVNYGVVTPGGRNAEERAKEWDAIFAFAHKMDLYGVTSEPRAEDMDHIEQLVKQYDIHFCIHDHPKQPKNPNYKFWDPNYVLSLVKDRDPRMGSCADTGHWLASGVDPIEALKILNGRVMSSHLKDRNQKGPVHHDVAWGSGVGDVKGVLAELKAQGFQGNIDIEYENDMEKDPATNAPKSFPDIAKSIAWFKEQGRTASAK
jgi:sugar phosphate isomerase/epimerase